MIVSVKHIKYSNDIILITLMLTNVCNYNCIYCIEKNNDNKSAQYLDTNIVIQFLNSIALYTNKQIVIELYGGEPTLHPELISFCQKLKSLIYIKDIELYTNFSADIELYKILLQMNICIYISYHSSINLSIQQFYKKICLLHTYNKFNKLYCYIMFEPTNTYNCYLLYKMLNVYIKKSNQCMYIYLCLIFSTPFYITKYKNNELQLFNTINKLYGNFSSYIINDHTNAQLTYNISLANSFNFKDWQCSAGQSSLFIASSGYIYPCDTMYRHRKNIKTNTINININNILYNNTLIHKLLFPTICKAPICPPCQSIYVKNVNKLNNNIINNTEVYFNV